MNITDLINILHRINNSEQIEDTLISELSGMGSMRFLFRDWNNSTGWSKADMPSFKHMSRLTEEVQVFSNKHGVTFESLQDSIKTSILTSYYTPEPIVTSLIKAVKTIEQQTAPVQTILDPSVGSGRFLKHLSSSFDKATILGIEKEPISAAIAKSYTLGLPGVKVVNNVYENAPYTQTYDLIISNIPFANINIHDSEAPKNVKNFQNTLHEFYFAKSLELLNPGGMLCFITSTGIMDNNVHQVLREELVANADLICAVRLPDDVFKREGIQVTTDVIFIRKPVGHKRKLSKQEVLFTKQPIVDLFSPSVAVNPYFTTFSENVLGNTIQGNQFGNENGMTVVSTDTLEEIAGKLDNLLITSANAYASNRLMIKAASKIAVQSQPQLFAPEVDSKSPLDKVLHYYNMYDRPGNIIGYNEEYGCAITLGQKVELNTTEHYVSYSDKDYVLKGKLPNKGELIKVIIDLRRSTQRMLTMKMDKAPEDKMLQCQRQLKSYYDIFQKYSHGLTLRQVLYKSNFDDIDISLVNSLELYDDVTKTVTLANIFNTDFCVEVEYNPKNIKDAVLHCYNKYGRIDVSYTAAIMNMSDNDFIVSALNDGIVRYDPLADNSICLPHVFRSGRVADKMRKLNELIAGERPDFISGAILNNHIKELAAIQPEFVPIGKIQPQIGEVIFNSEIYRRFFIKYTDINDEHISIVRENDVTKVLLHSLACDRVNAKLSVQTKGHRYFTGIDMMESILTNKQEYFTYSIEIAPGQYQTYTDHHANSEFARIKEDVYNHWQKFISSDVSVKKHIEQTYNQINAFVLPVADASLLDFSELEVLGITPRPYQATGIAKNIENNGGLQDCPPGGGKTIVAIVSAIKMKRMGIVKKPLIGGIIANIAKIVAEAKLIYPDAKILYADAKSFSSKNRHDFFAKIAHNDWDLILMSHSQLDAIPLNREAHIDVINEEIENVRTNIAVLKGVETSSLEQRMTKRELFGLSVKLNNLITKSKELTESTDNLSIDIIKMGIDHIMIDEAHLFKNLGFETKHYRIAGINNVGSKRASKLNIHLRAIRNSYYNGEDKGFTFLSATPILNSIPEMYTLFRLCSPSVLTNMRIKNFDSFIQIFAKMESDLELTVTGGYSYKTRCRYFIKTDLLLKLYHQMAHVVTPAEVNNVIQLPESHIHHINIPRTHEQEQYLYDLIEFANDGDRNLIQRVPKNKDANGAEMLLASTLSTLASIDMRLIDKDVYADYCIKNDNTKLNIVSRKVYDIYQKESDLKGTQLIFCDKGVPSKDKDSKGEFNVYSAIKEELVKLGVPANEIAFIHDYEDDKVRQTLERQVNDGIVRVCIGSTEKLGTGNNMQERMAAIHNIDIPWRPADFEQRYGRIRRSGNHYEEVDNFFYTTEKTLDGFRMEILKHKQNFIDQIRFQRQFDGSTIEDAHGDGDDIRYVDMVAEITGNPYVKEMAVTEKQYQMVSAEYKHVFEEKQTIMFNISENEANLTNAEHKIEAFTKAQEVYNQYLMQNADDPRFLICHGDNFGDILNVEGLGQYILDLTLTDTTKSNQHIANLGDNIAIFLIYESEYGMQTPTIRVKVLGEDRNEIINTAYNKGRIASLPFTVGMSPIKALDNIQVAKEWYVNKKDEYEKKKVSLDDRSRSYTAERLGALRETQVKSFSRIQELKVIIENEKGELIDKDKRIRYADIKNTTFTDAVKQRKIGTERNNTIIIDI